MTDMHPHFLRHYHSVLSTISDSVQQPSYFSIVKISVFGALGINNIPFCFNTIIGMGRGKGRGGGTHEN